MEEASGGSRKERIRVELAVDVKGEEDLEKINKLLANRKGVSIISAEAASKSLHLELEQQDEVSLANEDSSLAQAEEGERSWKNCCPVNAAQARSRHDSSQNIHNIQRLIEEQTGIVTVIKGLGQLQVAAVAELSSAKDVNHSQRQLIGVVRLCQLSNERCFVDGLLDRFNFSQNDCDDSKKCSLAIHEYGDLNDSAAFKSIGKPIINIDAKTEAEIQKCSKFQVQKVVPNCDLASMIGRSIALTSEPSQQVLCAGVIARAATTSSNKKVVCTCSGKTIWQERIERQNE